MRLLIIAIILLFSSTTLAQTTPEQIQLELSPTEFEEFIQLNIDRGLASDSRIYTGYLTKTYNYGTLMENMSVAMRYSACSIMWRNVLNSVTETRKLKHKMIYHAIWRAIEMAKWFTIRANGNPAKVEAAMIPIIATQEIVTNEAMVYGCTALDVAGFKQLSRNNHQVIPAEDWILEPIPEFEIPSVSSGPSGTAS